MCRLSYHILVPIGKLRTSCTSWCSIERVMLGVIRDGQDMRRPLPSMVRLITPQFRKQISIYRSFLLEGSRQTPSIQHPSHARIPQHRLPGSICTRPINTHHGEPANSESTYRHNSSYIDVEKQPTKIFVPSVSLSRPFPAIISRCTSPYIGTYLKVASTER